MRNLPVEDRQGHQISRRRNVGETPRLPFGSTGGAFSFGCVTGAFAGGSDHDAVQFDWNGNDEMDEACGHGWAELQPDGSLAGEICFHGGDEITFTARPWATSSTAC